jgi:hypothetical protein
MNPDTFLQRNKNKFITIGSLLFILIVLSGAIYYYFAVYRLRDQFGVKPSNVDEKQLEDSGYKKISLDSGKASFFVPNEWSQIDADLKVFGDVLTGANGYIAEYPNTLGTLNDDVCKNFVKEVFDNFQAESTYKVSELKETKVEKRKNYSGCLANIDSSIGGRKFKIKQFYILSEENIIQVFMQIPEDMNGREKMEETILDSVNVVA